MLLNQLKHPEKEAFFLLARHLITLNGIEAAEEEMLQAMCREMELEAPPQTQRSLPELCAAFESEEAKRIALIELLILSHADGQLQDEEADLGQQIVELFALEEGTVERAGRLAKSMFDLYRTTQRFVASPL